MKYKGINIIKEIWLNGTVRYILKNNKGKCIPLNYDLTSIDEAKEYIDTLNLSIQTKLMV